ncbi:hypothetical protein [Streptomyces halobius]|uniref:Uncharacterized protein n=1 Tax=Streptomyces halobius TaxID=2879846 RepID=A0ABY4M343_9ACTN|nr:hypothetical protein [Streptomyces halobius]UQA92172.1 hypothetical protein K9S39_10275 [Streptomyces halobius]
MGYSLEVGAPYPKEVNWPKSAANLVLSKAYVEIIYAFDGLTPDERAAFNTGAAAFAIVPGDRHLMWCYRFEVPTRPGIQSASLGWGDSPWEAHRQRDRVVGVPGREGEPFPAYMVLVDSGTGIVEGLRVADLDEGIADEIRGAVARQLAFPHDDAAASREINALYQRHPSTQSLLTEATAGQLIPALEN